MNDKFNIPHMRLWREDLKMADLPDNLSDAQMERIALLLGDLLQQDWSQYLYAIEETHPELFEVKKDV